MHYNTRSITWHFIRKKFIKTKYINLLASNINEQRTTNNERWANLIIENFDMMRYSHISQISYSKFKNAMNGMIAVTRWILILQLYAYVCVWNESKRLSISWSNERNLKHNFILYTIKRVCRSNKSCESRVSSLALLSALCRKIWYLLSYIYLE